jgi:hypothetical protein
MPATPSGSGTRSSVVHGALLGIELLGPQRTQPPLAHVPRHPPFNRLAVIVIAMTIMTTPNVV